MKTWVIFLLLILLPGLCRSAEPSFAGPEDPGFPADYQEVDTDPEPGEEIRKHAEDAQTGPQKNFGVQTRPR